MLRQELSKIKKFHTKKVKTYFAARHSKKYIPYTFSRKLPSNNLTCFNQATPSLHSAG